MFNYKIYKSNEKISFLTDVIFSALFSLALFGVAIFAKFDVTESTYNLLSSIVRIIVVLMALIPWIFVAIRLRPWKRPYSFSITNGLIEIVYPNGKEKKFSLDDVIKIRLESGSRVKDTIKKLVPVFFIGKYSWNAVFWSLYMGKLWLATDTTFLHFYLSNKSSILVPVPEDKLDLAVDQLSSVFKKEEIKKPLLPKKALFFLKLFAIFIILIVPSFNAFIFILSRAKSISSALVTLSMMIGLGVAILIGLLLFFVLFYLTWRAFKEKSTIIGGMTLEGPSAYAVGVLYFILALIVLATTALTAFIGYGAIIAAAQKQSAATTETPTAAYSDWQLYKNDEYGFEFRYPETWNLTANGGQGPAYKVITRVVNPSRAGKPDTDVPIEQFLVRSLDHAFTSCLGGSVVLEGKTGTDSGWSEGFGLIQYRNLCFDDQNGPFDTFDITMSAYDKPAMATMDSILSTFKFTK